MLKIATYPDEQLVEQARNGSEHAFREIVRRYQSKVAGVAIRMLGRSPEAEDVGQETFIRFFRSLEQFRGDSSVGTYLTRIAINLSLNAVKKRKKAYFEVAVEDASAELKNHSDADFQSRAEAREIVYKALDKMDEDSRAVIVLRMIEGYSTKETAEILEVPTGTVLSRLSRAQEKLKSIIGNIY